MGDALMRRLPRIVAAVAGGLLMSAGFAPLAWWWAPMLAMAVLAAVLRWPTTTAAGGFGYGLLFGLAFYLPLLPWVSGFVGVPPWLALCTMCALFPALFGWLAVVVRGLPGWPVWFALLWVAQEWLKSSVPFGGFPWGVAGFSQAGGPLLALAQWGGAPLLSLAVALVGFALAALVERVEAVRHRLERVALAGHAGELAAGHQPHGHADGEGVGPGRRGAERLPGLSGHLAGGPVLGTVPAEPVRR